MLQLVGKSQLKYSSDQQFNHFLNYRRISNTPDDIQFLTLIALSYTPNYGTVKQEISLQTGCDFSVKFGSIYDHY